MNDCKFACAFPDYVLDRVIIIKDGHEHRVSGYKLAKSSEYFRDKLKQIRYKEIERSRRIIEQTPTGETFSQNVSLSSDPNREHKRTGSVNELEIEHIETNYEDPEALEYVVSFIHCQDNLDLPQLQLTSNNLLSVVKAGYAFKVPTLISHCLGHIKNDINSTNCWSYYQLLSEMSSLDKDIYNHIHTYILDNFLSIFKSEGFLVLSHDKIQHLLRNDSLNCNNEALLIDVIDKWIDYNKSDRISFHLDLLKLVRMGLLNAKQIEKLSSNIHIKSNWSETVYLLTWSQLDINESTKRGEILSQETVDLIKYMNKPRFPREAIIVVGGWEGNQDDPNFGPSKAIQIYNNRANTWKRLDTNIHALDEGHAYSGCVRLNTKIYVIGGYVSSGPTQTLKMYDLKTQKWKYMSPMHEKRNYISATSLDDKIYAIGGHNGRTRLNSVEKYDPDLNNWTLITPMNQVRSDAGSASLNSKLYVCGGFDGHHFYSSVEMYNPKTDQWTEVAHMNSIRSGVSLIAFGAHLYAIGGNDGLQRLRSVERFDPETNRWQSMAAMIRQRSNFCITILENEVYVMGGWSDETNSTISLVEKWQPSMTNEWKTVQQLFMPASANCCCAISGLDIIQKLLSK